MRVMWRPSATVFLFFCLMLRLGAQAGGQPPVTAILGALPPEINVLKTQLQGASEERIMKLSFVTGTLAGQPVVLGVTGDGKVNAAVMTAILIEHFHPRRLIFSGIAGALDPALKPGDLVIGASTVQHDMGDIKESGFELSTAISPVLEKHNPIFFEAAPELVDLATSVSAALKLEALATSQGLRTPRIVKGRIATGDQFIATAEAKARIRTMCEADATEMEGGAIAQVCYEYQVPCLIIRSISDNADAQAGADMRKFRHIAMRNAAQLVMAILGGLQDNPK